MTGRSGRSRPSVMLRPGFSAVSGEMASYCFIGGMKLVVLLLNLLPHVALVIVS